MSSTLAPSVWKMRLTFAFCSAKPNWMPMKPKHMFQICQKLRRGFMVESPLLLTFHDLQFSVIRLVDRPVDAAAAAGVFRVLVEVAHVEAVIEHERAALAGLRGEADACRRLTVLVLRQNEHAALRRSAAAL